MIKVILLLLLISFSANAETAIVVAHRGASKDAPENTIPAFNLAWKQGANAIEADFLLSKDNRIVCIHNHTTGSVSSKILTVSKSTLAQLRTLDVGSRTHGERFKGTRIPVISEVFATVPQEKKIYIEIKCGVEIIQPLLEEIRKSSLKDSQIVIICFKPEVIKMVKSKAPQFKAYWLATVARNQTTHSVLKTLKSINADGFSTSWKNITEDFIKNIKDEGFEYHVWTVNDAKTAKRFNQWGAQSITTNVPADIKKALADQNSTIERHK